MFTVLEVLGVPLFRSAKPKMKARLLADTPIPAGQQTIPLDEVVWTEGDVQLLAGGGVQVDRAGAYLVQGSLSRPSIGTTSQMQVRFRVNGVGIDTTPTLIVPTTTAVITAQVCDVLPLEEGDTVTLVGTLSSTATTNARRTGTFLTVVRIGPKKWTG